MTRTGHECEQCGARYASAGDSCVERFGALLALDHSRTEPWGSRHGVAFAVFVLQHVSSYGPLSVERSWQYLQRVYVSGEAPMAVARGMRRAGEGPTGWDVPPLPGTARRPHRFAVTIADLGEFTAESYAERLDDWCRATLGALQEDA